MLFKEARLKNQSESLNPGRFQQKLQDITFRLTVS